MAKDKLIFIIICSVALAVAAVTMVQLFTKGSGRIRTRTSWECLDCGYDFDKKTEEAPPIECVKCGEQAVRRVYRDCSKCGEEVFIYRIRAIGKSTAPPASGQATGPPIMAPPAEVQFEIKQADGSFGWTDWVPSSSQQAAQLRNEVHCQKCDTALFSASPR